MTRPAPCSGTKAPQTGMSVQLPLVEPKFAVALLQVQP